MHSRSGDDGLEMDQVEPPGVGWRPLDRQADPPVERGLAIARQVVGDETQGPATANSDSSTSVIMAGDSSAETSATSRMQILRAALSTHMSCVSTIFIRHPSLLEASYREIGRHKGTG